MLKLQYFGHLMQRAHSLGKTLMLGKTEGRRRRGKRGWVGWMALPNGLTWVWASSWSWWWTGRPGVLQSMGSQRVGHNYVTQLNWTNVRIKYEIRSSKSSSKNPLMGKGSWTRNHNRNWIVLLSLLFIFISSCLKYTQELSRHKEKFQFIILSLNVIVL